LIDRIDPHKIRLCSICKTNGMGPGYRNRGGMSA
jgi:hypothetical protein